ncbi:MAG: hypothetical protein NTY47_01795 [Candidatus Omnitrophica bacterium]|nr:hypothetical protein [Candidatus Omnitrophota bacterium]
MPADLKANTAIYTFENRLSFLHKPGTDYASIDVFAHRTQVNLWGDFMSGGKPFAINYGGGWMRPTSADEVAKVMGRKSGEISAILNKPSVLWLHSDKLAKEMRSSKVNLNPQQQQVLTRMEANPSVGFIPDSIQHIDFGTDGNMIATQYLSPLTDKTGNVLALRTPNVGKVSQNIYDVPVVGIGNRLFDIDISVPGIADHAIVAQDIMKVGITANPFGHKLGKDIDQQTAEKYYRDIAGALKLPGAIEVSGYWGNEKRLIYSVVGELAFPEAFPIPELHKSLTALDYYHEAGVKYQIEQTLRIDSVGVNNEPSFKHAASFLTNVSGQALKDLTDYPILKANDITDKLVQAGIPLESAEAISLRSFGSSAYQNEDNLVPLVSGVLSYVDPQGKQQLYAIEQAQSDGKWHGDVYVNNQDLNLLRDQDGLHISPQMHWYSTVKDGKISQQIRYDFRDANLRLDSGVPYQADSRSKVIIDLLTFDPVGKVDSAKLSTVNPITGEGLKFAEGYKRDMITPAGFQINADGLSSFSGIAVYDQARTNRINRTEASPNPSLDLQEKQLDKPAVVNEGIPQMLTASGKLFAPEFNQITLDPETGIAFKDNKAYGNYYRNNLDKPLALQAILNAGDSFAVLNNELRLTESAKVKFGNAGTALDNGLWVMPAPSAVNTATGHYVSYDSNGKVTSLYIKPEKLESGKSSYDYVNVIAPVIPLHTFDLNKSSVWSVEGIAVSQDPSKAVMYLSGSDMLLHLSDTENKEFTKRSNKALATFSELELLAQEIQKLENIQGRTREDDLLLENRKAQLDYGYKTYLASDYHLPFDVAGQMLSRDIGSLDTKVARYPYASARYNRQNPEEMYPSFIYSGDYNISPQIANADPRLDSGLWSMQNWLQGTLQTGGANSSGAKDQGPEKRPSSMNVSPFWSTTDLTLSSKPGQYTFDATGRLELMFVNQKLQENFAQGSSFSAPTGVNNEMTFITPGNERSNGTEAMEIYKVDGFKGRILMGSAGMLTLGEGMLAGKAKGIPTLSILALGRDAKGNITARGISGMNMPEGKRFNVNTLPNNIFGRRAFFMDEALAKASVGLQASALLENNAEIAAGTTDLQFAPIKGIASAYEIIGKGNGATLWDGLKFVGTGSSSGTEAVPTNMRGIIAANSGYSLVSNAWGSWNIYGDNLKVFRPSGKQGPTLEETNLINRTLDLQPDGRTVFSVTGQKGVSLPVSLSAGTQSAWQEGKASSQKQVVGEKEWDALIAGKTLTANEFHFGRNMCSDDIGPGTTAFVLPSSRGPNEFGITINEVSREGAQATTQFKVANPGEGILRFDVGSQGPQDFRLLTGEKLGSVDSKGYLQLLAAKQQDYTYDMKYLKFDSFDKALALVKPILDAVTVSGQDGININALAKALSDLYGKMNLPLDEAQLRLLLSNKDKINNNNYAESREAIMYLGKAIAVNSGRQDWLDRPIFARIVPGASSTAKIIVGFLDEQGKEIPVGKEYAVTLIDQGGNPFINNGQVFAWFSTLFRADGKVLAEGSRTEGMAVLGTLKDAQGKPVDNPAYMEASVFSKSDDKAPVIPLFGINNTLFNLTNYVIGQDNTYFGWSNGMLRKWTRGSHIDFEKVIRSEDGKPVSSSWQPLVTGRFAPVFSNEVNIARDINHGTFFGTLARAGAWWQAIVQKDDKGNYIQSYMPLNNKGEAIKKGAAVDTHLSVSNLYWSNGQEAGKYVSNPKTSYWNASANGYVLAFDITDPKYNTVYGVRQQSANNDTTKTDNRLPIPATIKERVGPNAKPEQLKALPYSIIVIGKQTGETDKQLEITGQVIRDAVMYGPFSNFATPALFIPGVAAAVKADNAGYVVNVDLGNGKTKQIGSGNGAISLGNSYRLLNWPVLCPKRRNRIIIGTR